MADTQPKRPEILLQCPTCLSRLRVERQVSFLEEQCPVCRSEVRMTIFPRLFHEFSPAHEGIAVEEGEASCSFFPELRAEKVCDECGAFLSERAAISWCGRDLCLPCLHRLREIEKDPGYLGRSRIQDKRALALVTWLLPFSLFTGPLAIYLLLRYRGKPEGFVPRGKAVWWVAMILALLSLLAWIVFIVIWISLIVENFS